VAEQHLLVSEASRRWLCRELSGADFFDAARASRREVARREVLARLDAACCRRPPGWRRLASRWRVGLAG
jgi:hypothetical protein